MTEPGELTHIDLWGKYVICSLQGKQYDVVFVDMPVNGSLLIV